MENLVVPVFSEALAANSPGEGLTELTAFTPFARRSLSELLDFGQEMARLLESCTTPESKKAFREWAAQQYGKKFAEKAIALWRWWSELTAEVQQQIQQIPLSYWPIATALSLTKLGHCLGEYLREIAVLPSLTVRALENLIRQFTPKRPAPLHLGQEATEADWHYLAQKLALSEDEIAALQQKASEFAALEPETGERLVTTDALVDALEASGYDTSRVLSKPASQARQLASTEQELESEKQARLAAQAQVNESYAQLREAQVAAKETQTQLKEKEAVIEEKEAVIARMSQELAEFQRQASRPEVPETDWETAKESEIQVDSTTDSEAAAAATPPTVVTVEGTKIIQEYETQNFKDITPFVLGTNDISNGNLPINNGLQNHNFAESAGQIVHKKTSDSSHQKQKRKRANFLTEMSRLAVAEKA